MGWYSSLQCILLSQGSDTPLIDYRPDWASHLRICGILLTWCPLAVVPNTPPAGARGAAGTISSPTLPLRLRAGHAQTSAGG